MPKDPTLGEHFYAIIRDEKDSLQIFEFEISEEVTTRTLTEQTVTLFVKSPYLKGGTKATLEKIRKFAFLKKVFTSLDDMKEEWISFHVDAADESFNDMLERARKFQKNDEESNEDSTS